jgi:hypothetical protein
VNPSPNAARLSWLSFDFVGLDPECLLIAQKKLTSYMLRRALVEDFVDLATPASSITIIDELVTANIQRFLYKDLLVLSATIFHGGIIPFVVS